jgi:hypothetical protein
VCVCVCVCVCVKLTLIWSFLPRGSSCFEQIVCMNLISAFELINY